MMVSECVCVRVCEREIEGNRERLERMCLCVEESGVGMSSSFPSLPLSLYISGSFQRNYSV